MSVAGRRWIKKKQKKHDNYPACVRVSVLRGQRFGRRRH